MTTIEALEGAAQKSMDVHAQTMEDSRQWHLRLRRAFLAEIQGTPGEIKKVFDERAKSLVAGLDRVSESGQGGPGSPAPAQPAELPNGPNGP